GRLQASALLKLPCQDGCEVDRDLGMPTEKVAEPLAVDLEHFTVADREYGGRAPGSGEDAELPDRGSGSQGAQHPRAAFPFADVLEQPLAVAEHDRNDVKLEPVDRAGGQVLLDDARPTSEQDVLVAGDVPRLVERGPDPVGDEEEGGASIHLDGFARMVREDEGRDVIRRVLSPPALPGRIFRPRAGPAPEHVPAHHDRADVRLGFLHHGRAGVDLATLLSFRRSPRLEVEEPSVQPHAADTERVLHALMGAGDVSVERDRNVEPERSHRILLSLSRCHDPSIDPIAILVGRSLRANRPALDAIQMTPATTEPTVWRRHRDGPRDPSRTSFILGSAILADATIVAE